LRTDILHDCGASLNPAIDLGQIEGGYVQGAGWLTTEELVWDDRGRLRTHAPSTYKIPACGDRPRVFNVALWDGENRILRCDILHDCGASLNPALDIGQIEGGYVQGAGWLTTEELVWDGKGRLRTHAPSTYKIPACSDRPDVFNVALWDGANREDTVYRSKAVGEPPFMLGISAFLAISDAVSACRADYPALDAPATAERILTTLSR
jgi:xanthine dehydrogenase large subunit